MVSALLHAAIPFFIMAVIFGTVRIFAPKRNYIYVLSLILFVIVAADVTSVNRQFIHVRDKKPFYQKNPIAASIQADTNNFEFKMF